MSETNETPSGFPITLYEYNWSTFFNLISISILIEDRRPDIKEMIGKFKHQIKFRFFHKEVSIVTRSTTGLGTYIVDGKTVITSVQ